MDLDNVDVKQKIQHYKSTHNTLVKRLATGQDKKYIGLDSKCKKCIITKYLTLTSCW